MTYAEMRKDIERTRQAQVAEGYPAAAVKTSWKIGGTRFQMFALSHPRLIVMHYVNGMKCSAAYFKKELAKGAA